MTIPRELAARLPGLHERQEQLEAENLLAAGLGEELGVSTTSWDDGLWGVRTMGAPNHRPGNQLIGVTPDHLEVLPERIAWLADAGCGVHLRWPGPAVSHSVGAALAAMGLVAHELEAWMASPVDGLEVEAPTHHIERVDDADAVDDWMRAFIGGWAITKPELQRIVRAAMGPWPGPSQWRRYVAYVDGEPAGDSLLTLFGDVAYLAEASTVPRFRRRGIQRAMIAHRLAEARAAGATTIFSAVQYGDRSWSNMRAMGLREAYLTLSFRRPA